MLLEGELELVVWNLSVGRHRLSERFETFVDSWGQYVQSVCNNCKEDWGSCDVCEGKNTSDARFVRKSPLFFLHNFCSSLSAKARRSPSGRRSGRGSSLGMLSDRLVVYAYILVACVERMGR